MWSQGKHETEEGYKKKKHLKGDRGAKSVEIIED